VRTVQRQLSPYPKTDVRYIPTLPEELQQVQDVEPAALRKLHAEFLGSHAGQLVVVGDFDPEPTLAALSGFLQGWKAKQPYERLTRSGQVDVKGDLVRVETPDKANAFYFSGLVMPLNDSDPSYPALVIGNYVFGAGALSSRLGDRIRQKEGLSYGVGSAFRAASLDERASLSMYAITNPGNMDKVIAGIREELQKMLDEGVTEAELQSARDGFLQSQSVARTEDANLARVLEDTLYAGRTMAYYSGLERQIKELTVADIQAAFRQRIDPRRIFTVVAGDFRAGAAETKPKSESGGR
jgi:zinc protease